jgi:hypothetical protein
MVWATQLSSGNGNDNTQVVGVLSHVEIKDSKILGDKAYGTRKLGIISYQKSFFTQFLQNPILKIHGNVIGGFIRNVI